MSDESTLQEIRERFDYATSEWDEIRREGRKDMRYIAGDPWEPEDRTARQASGRPALALDELGQYVNQLINDIRQNKRAIKVTPVGNGATDQTAELRQALIRQIEYRSNAQQVYTTMFENTVQRSYGYLRVKPRYVSERSFDQELRIEACPNPDLVTPDPDGMMPDGSDWKYLFLHERWKVKDFKKAFPDAQIQSFDGAAIAKAPKWISADGDDLQLAEYWAIETTRRQLFLLKPGPAVEGQPPPAPTAVFLDELQGPPRSDSVLDTRFVDDPAVCQYLTNGVELLAKKGAKKKTPWPGKSIPFVACYGKLIYVDEGAGSKRKLLSMIRLARDPYMLYCYYRTAQAEVVKRTTKNSAVGYVGQFRGQEDNWQRAVDEPVAFLTVQPKIDGVNELLPLPVMNQWEPPIQALEMGAEGARRAIQAAMGASPLPTQAQRHNEKSGVALKEMNDTSQKGSFHFVDHYDDALTRAGQILDELIPKYYDNARDVTVRKPNDDPRVLRINDPSKPDDDGTVPKTTEGDHDVTISTGPNFESEREEGSQFASDLIGNPELAQVIGPQKMAKLMALAVKLKAVGPIGDQMADIIDPPDPNNDPAAAAQQAQQLQQENQQLKGLVQQQADALKADTIKAQATIDKAKVDATAAVKLQMMKDATSIAVAKINALTKGVASANEAEVEAIALAHEATQNALDRAHDVGMAAEQHAQGLEAAQQDQAHALEQGDQGHQQALEQGDAGVAGQIAVQAAAPQPEAGAGA